MKQVTNGVVSPQAAGGLPNIASGTVFADTDHDGMQTSGKVHTDSILMMDPMVLRTWMETGTQI